MPFQIQVLAATLVFNKDLYQVLETLENMCEFSTVCADQAGFWFTENFFNLAKGQ